MARTPSDVPAASAPGALAAIDIGTNSVHMLIARVAANGRFEVITRLKEMVRLGSGQGEMRELEPAAIDRGIAALARCRNLADSFDAPVYAVATSAVREARNAEDFLHRARTEAGVEVHVISGYEEARLIQLGVLQALPLFEERIVVIDVGGGSTEIVFGRRGEAKYARSIKLGSLRMTRRFFPDGVVKGDAVRRCRRYVQGRLAPIIHEAEHLIHDVAVASSGTAEALAAIAIQARNGSSTPQSLNAATFTRDELGAVVDLLASATTPEERKLIPGVESSRADILLGGAIVLEQVCDALGITELTISDYALREGVLLDALHRLEGGSLHHLSDLRRTSVFHLMELCDDDPEHSLQVARLALQLHDAFCEQLGLGDAERELLEAAALLCNVGMFISHSGHHKHSYYVIRNSEHLMGFTDREIEVIAQVARYHRKSRPSDKHGEFASLDEADQQHVRAMAALLRVAIGLDRNHDGAVDTIRVSRAEDTTTITVDATVDGTDLALETYSATERSGLLGVALGTEVTVVASPDEA